MVQRRMVASGLLTVACLLLYPLGAWAQQASGIAGVARDTSGAVLPGVTVEAESPALIERVRVVYTDDQGRYNIVDLRPGSYTVTFTLPGFATFRRDGIELTAGFTAQVNADMRVGAIEETITVTGAVPLVDTQNVRLQAAVSEELRTALPSGTANLMGLSTLIPGMTNGLDVGGGGAVGIYYSNQSTSANVHGKAGSKQFYDGMQTNNLSGEGSTTYTMNPYTVEESVVETGGISAESSASGLSINMVPKEGSNTFAYFGAFTYTNEHLQATNLTDKLRERGLEHSSQVLSAYDVNFTVGGPIKPDKMWFFAATRLMGTRNQVPGHFFNATQGTPIFTPDLSRPQYSKDWLRSQAVRVTWQATSLNKFNVFVDPQTLQTRGTGSNTAPESHTCWDMWPNGLFMGSWTSPVTNRLLLEGGVSLTKGLFPCTLERATDIFDFTVKPTDISIVEASTGLRYNARSSSSPQNDQDRYMQRFSVSYITGTHAYKFGMQLQQHVHDQSTEINQDVNYRFNNGRPIRITQYSTPYTVHNRTKADLGIYAQDQWSLRRLTLNYGLRYDYFNGYVTEQHVPAGRFVGERNFDKVEGVPLWHDLSPRLGGSYDLFGTGRTALKASIGRYVGRETTVFARANNPIATSINNANRSWNDRDGDYVPDCDLTNFAANGECGALDNENFGKIDPTAVTYSDDLLRGWGNREYFWEIATEVQHEVRPGTSLNAGFYRNWTHHYGDLPRGENTVGHEDNLAIGPDDFEPYCVTAPVHPGLPGGGGYEVCGLYDIRPEKFGIGDVVVRRADQFGNGKTRISNFVTVSVRSRIGDGIQLNASLDTGRTTDDRCFVIDSPQSLLHCKTINPFKGQTQIKVNAVYPLPGDIVLSAILQNLSGLSYTAAWNAPTASIAPSLGRNLAGGARTATVPLIEPYTQFEPRRTVVDLRVSKSFSLGERASVKANLDFYNLFNDSSIVGINNNFGGSWRKPSGNGGGISAPRLIQIGAQVNF